MKNNSRLCFKSSLRSVVLSDCLDSNISDEYYALRKKDSVHFCTTLRISSSSAGVGSAPVVAEALFEG